VTAERDCPACGGSIPPPAGTGRRQGRRRRWCSPRCRYAARGRSDQTMRELRSSIDAMNEAFKEAAK
jgi:hypothetical protein